MLLVACYSLTISAFPPACSIFARALTEKACARTVIAFSRSPVARILIGRSDFASPACFSVSGVTSLLIANRARLATSWDPGFKCRGKGTKEL